MKKIYSKTKPGTLLHIVNRLNDPEMEDLQEKKGGGRVDIAPETEFLQVAALQMNAGKTFKAHKHITHKKTTDIAQESWVVLSGSVNATFYDLDDTVISEELLSAGDLSLTFRGGHNYKAMSPNTFVYEFKTGPYLGQKLDKSFIE
jgi:hypothetical protein